MHRRADDRLANLPSAGWQQWIGVVVWIALVATIAAAVRTLLDCTKINAPAGAMRRGSERFIGIPPCLRPPGMPARVSEPLAALDAGPTPHCYAAVVGAFATIRPNENLGAFTESSCLSKYQNESLHISYF